MAVNGQLWYLTQGSGSETKLVRINDDGSQSTIVASGAAALATSVPQEVAVDTAAGLYFVVSNGGVGGDHAVLLMGHINSAAAPTAVLTFPVDDIVNTIQINPTTHSIYVGYTDIDLNVNLQGIVQLNYDPLTGATAPKNGTVNNSFIITQATANVQSSVASGQDLMDPRDFALDTSTNTLYFAQHTDGDGYESNMIWRVDLDNPTAAAVPLLQQSLFALDNDGNNNFVSANGFIIDVEVDSSNNKVYFTTESQHPSPDSTFNTAQNAIWYIDGSANAGTPTKLTLTGFADSALFYPGDMVFDAGNRQIYVESEQNGNLDADDVIYVFQLNAAGTSASYVKTIDAGLSDSDGSGGANISGLFYNNLPNLTVTAASAHAVEQSNYTVFLTTRRSPTSKATISPTPLSRSVAAFPGAATSFRSLA